MLITVFVPTYNRASRIDRVLDAVLAMKVPAGCELEYVWSDDCSTDGTFEILQRKAAEYRGPWKIILNRNPENLRLARHVQAIGKIGHGEWFVECDSDDIPFPERLCILADAIKKYPDMKGFCSGKNINGKYSGVFGKQLFPCGATCCWHRNCFTSFSSEVEQTWSQDVYIPFRALLLGGTWVFADVATVDYVIAEDNASTPLGLDRIESLLHLVKIKEHLILAIRQRLHDLALMPPDNRDAERILREKHEFLIARLEREIERTRFMAVYLQAGMREKLSLLKNLPETIKNNRKERLRLWLYFFPAIGNLRFAVGRMRFGQTEEKSEPTGKYFPVDLDFIVKNPNEFLIML